MIAVGLVEMMFSIFRSLLSGLTFMTLPTDLIAILGSIMGYGTWIVGADLMSLFVASVVFWWGVHLSIGLAVWVWEKIPFI